MNPAFGRGRGRGQGRGRINQNDSPWSVKTPASSESSTKIDLPIKGSEVSNEHENMRIKMVRMAEKYMDMAENDDSSEEDMHEDEIINKTVKEYQNLLQDQECEENQFLIDVLQSGAVTCLVCIENVKRLDAIWSCSQCCCIFHLQCIQKWAKEGVGRQALSCNEDISKQNFTWHCPKCRHEYTQQECPTKYICFCAKEENPAFDPWIVPHSCGQRCEKPLMPKCGHNCLLLCHPGPCPPCPKTVNNKCHCGRKGPMLKRCSNKNWSCGKTCERDLSCGHHTCKEFCHSGDCPPCPFKSEQPCLCGKNNATRECANPEWSCGQECSKNLSCGHHVCERICHSGPCGDCPRSGLRTCPCGKTESTLPCTENVSSCEDTCLKDLTCGKHKCTKRCHYGACETCLQVVEKTCRCARRRKEVPCSQPFICDFKCTNTKTCGRHQCKRKCCDGTCPPCEQICNRTLNCRNHKCPSPCHQGMCYPCPLTKKVTCYCTKTAITVPCGKEKTTKPPRCKQSCGTPPDCHHTSRANHRCHYGRCPPCKYKCEKTLSGCQHLCQETCHDHIFDKEATELNKLRSASKKAVRDVFVSLPCPSCKTPVSKLCLGEHVNEDFPCSEVKPYSCRRPCGRLLACGNHTCERECHVVKGHPPEGKAGRNCIPCEEICLKDRPSGCIHDCKLPCHPDPCPECETHLKLSCHCSMVKMYVKCSEFNNADDEKKDSILCCKARCPKLMSCGHICPKVCHKDVCGDPEVCVEMTKLKCSCGRKKKDFPCPEVRSGVAKLDCDERCKEMKDKKKKEQKEKEESEKAAELKKQQEELEKYERKKQGKKRKQRRVTETEDEEGFFKKNQNLIIMITVVVVLMVAVLIGLSQTR
ncbi:NF-X1-type zinc finger protein NFXL1-like [Hydractinia symbiolongicarpus]|uniref:NF-X1-type zinc finger protein NFXL1-like n=1 Tax=Hydractinia symbiolongicarpus TaxID=13093 RepID=UPI0025515C2A|nr:NF-X1-type zinc finger protein NFXL1-like [Hydractinia symbiolongicarpus]XP_057312602.1 NF-X1-type zinc finger protein NFXL1-like [Hydractinia symbiolongicarpus]